MLFGQLTFCGNRYAPYLFKGSGSEVSFHVLKCTFCHQFIYSSLIPLELLQGTFAAYRFTRVPQNINFPVRILIVATNTCDTFCVVSCHTSYMILHRTLNGAEGGLWCGDFFYFSHKNLGRVCVVAASVARNGFYSVADCGEFLPDFTQTFSIVFYAEFVVYTVKLIVAQNVHDKTLLI